jgi:hypothetical protein
MSAPVASDTFAMDEQMESLRLAMHGKSVGKRLSAGTEVAAATWTPKPTEDFKYWADVTLVTTFESYQAYDRSVFVLAVAAACTLAGARTFREIGDHAADLPQEVLRDLGGRSHPLRRRITAPGLSLGVGVGEFLDEHVE